ncbi:TPA: ABC transporter [candidate division WWE3 bacterium]|uniref:ABC transporter n=1 Tax=candidate division WWE3 bacterium TaxID=2053526 RepID=A0A656PPP9_UNCKA|nr:ABC transporter ATP-binding component [candidate division WWE3 bacterium RAAC2_WWE3_1]KKS29504.1 MAG: ABC transporter ATP-binding component [candidate division WWE3 bacterium GW2011_GWB1_42_117]KKS54890.1 MAG: ABC transporter ATP-binding component [candidate division WWE3 bacterium GW2011_GWD2_42_34]KKT05506.1 MAG: ABC transporter ATP-binding component [candidate division WWE3 bacterium GW2011_GWE2_43_18]KKT06741.1 MAG: ABC transporter ATP-binding component [candidate division WWE3 bacterium
MITLTKLSKRFDRQFVVSDVNLKINQGEIIGLLGPNGAGKTTTLRMIAGVLPPSKGTVVIDETNIETDGIVKKRIGFLPENNPLYEELTVEEYLSFWSDMKEIPKSERQEAIDFVVDRCGISEVYYRPISELSKGYRQRVGLSQAILTKPDILILDEPTEGLDPNQRQDIAALIRDLGKERTVIISSHVLSELAKIVNRMVIIHKGAIVADETPDNLRRLGSSSQTVEIEVKGNHVLSTLKKVDGVIDVHEIKKDYFVVEIEKKLDIREKLYKLAVKNKWTLLTLVAKERAIEDVFSQLTSN